MLAKQVLSMSFQNAGFGLLCLFVNRLWWRSNIDWSLLAGDDAGVLFIPFQTVRFRKSFVLTSYSETPKNLGHCLYVVARTESAS